MQVTFLPSSKIQADQAADFVINKHFNKTKSYELFWKSTTHVISLLLIETGQVKKSTPVHV